MIAWLTKKYFEVFKECGKFQETNLDKVLVRFRVYKKDNLVVLELSSGAWILPFNFEGGAAEHLGRELFSMADPAETDKALEEEFQN